MLDTLTGAYISSSDSEESEFMVQNAGAGDSMLFIVLFWMVQTSFDSRFQLSLVCWHLTAELVRDEATKAED